MANAITYLGRNDLDHSVTFAFRTDRWEYFLANPAIVDKIEYMVRVASAAKALVFAKRVAIKAVRQ